MCRRGGWFIKMSPAQIEMPIIDSRAGHDATGKELIEQIRSGHRVPLGSHAHARFSVFAEDLSTTRRRCRAWPSRIDGIVCLNPAWHSF
jgi:hypothetical protein